MSEAVNIRILDREYTVGVDPDERENLLSAARLLESKMLEVRGSNRMAALDRVTVLAALNLAHELEQLRNENVLRDREIARTLVELNHRIDTLSTAD